MLRRKTAARSAILAQIRTASAACSHEMLERELGDSINRATIYRTLKRLQEDGEVHRVVGSDGVQYYALCQQCTEDNHQHAHVHFQCLTCARVECLDQELQVKLPQGYRAVEWQATVTGICRECRPSGAAS